MCIYAEKDLEDILTSMALYDSTPKVIVVSDDSSVKIDQILAHLSIYSPKTQYFTFTSMHSSITSAKTELEYLSQQVQEIFNIPVMHLSCWDDTLFSIAEQVKHGNCVLILNEVNQLSKSNEAIAECLFIQWESKLKHIKGCLLIRSHKLSPSAIISFATR